MNRQLIALLEQALPERGPEDRSLRVRLLSRLAGALRDQPSVERRAALGAEAVEMARRIGDPETLTTALIGRWAAVALGADGWMSSWRSPTRSTVAGQVGDRKRAIDAQRSRFIFW